MAEMKYAPIVLFVYSRPEHTRRTLEALSENTIAKDSSLIIHVDGLRPDASEMTRKANEEVKSIVHEKQWCGKVIIKEKPENKGLAASIRDGVTEALEEYGRVIVVEDDLVTSPAFLIFMNKALDFYKDYPAVFSIGGYTFPPQRMHIPKDYGYDTYACLRNCSWGWATWKDRWDKVDWNAKNYECLKDKPAIKEAFNRMGDDEFEMLFSQQERGLNIWSILFTLAHFENHAVTIIPCVSYVDNIGLDGTGENCCVQNGLSNTKLCQDENPKFLSIIYEDKRIINAFYNVNCRTRLPLWKRFVNRLYRKMKGKPKYLKGQVYL